MITPVKKVMTEKLFTIPLGTTLHEANELMQEKRIRHLPIVDEMDVIIGMISQRDLQYVPESKNIRVEMMMSTPVQFVPADMPLRKAIFQILQNKISCLLVADPQGTAIGIVTTDDLLWCLAHHLADEKEDPQPLLNFKTRQTIGEVANELSQMGI